MPILTPNFNTIDYTESESLEEKEDILTNGRAEAISEILSDGGIDRDKLIPLDSENDNFKRVLNRSGASVENASRTIAHVMKKGKYENSKLRAAELVLDLHGVRDKDGRVNKQPIFQFFIKDSAVNINQIFAPVRSASIEEFKELSLESDDSEDNLESSDG